MYEGSVQHAHVCTLSVIHVRRVCTSRNSIFFEFRSKAPYNMHVYVHGQLYMYEGSVQYTHICTLPVIHVRRVHTTCTCMHIVSYECKKDPYIQEFNIFWIPQQRSVQYAHISVIRARRVRTCIVKYIITCNVLSYTCTKGPYMYYNMYYCQLYMYEGSVHVLQHLW